MGLLLREERGGNGKARGGKVGKGRGQACKHSGLEPVLVVRGRPQGLLHKNTLKQL